MRWCPLRSMPWAEAAGSHARIWTTSGLMECTPTWFSVNLVYWKWREILSFPTMELSWHKIFCLLKVTAWSTWRNEIEATHLVRCWGHWTDLSMPSMNTWPSRPRNNGWPYGWRTIRVLLLIVCLKSLNSITSPGITTRIRRDQRGSNWTPCSSTRAVEKKHLK